jgi:hypothetical protein
MITRLDGTQLPEVFWAPYKEFGIPDKALEKSEPPSELVRISATGYRGIDVILYWTPQPEEHTTVRVGKQVLEFALRDVPEMVYASVPILDNGQLKRLARAAGLVKQAAEDEIGSRPER